MARIIRFIFFIFVMLFITNCSSMQSKLSQGSWRLTGEDCNDQGICIINWHTESSYSLIYEDGRKDYSTLTFDPKNSLEITFFKKTQINGPWNKIYFDRYEKEKADLYNFKIDGDEIILTDPGTSAVVRWKIIKLYHSTPGYDVMLINENGVIKMYKRHSWTTGDDIYGKFSSAGKECATCCIFPFFLFAILGVDLTP